IVAAQFHERLLAFGPTDLVILDVLVLAGRTNALLVETDRLFRLADAALELHGRGRPLIGNDTAPAEFHDRRKSIIGSQRLADLRCGRPIAHEIAPNGWPARTLNAIRR